MAKSSKSAVTENYELPSKGKLYGEDFPSEVTIRSMTTFEEKMRLGNQGFIKTMCNIINSVVTSPEDFKVENMTLFDFYFLMYKMRIVSYGPTYKVTVTCPTCGKRTVVNVDLDKLEVNYLPEDFSEPFDIGPLPRSGDILTCRLLRVKDIISVDRRSQEILKKNPEYVGDPSYILTPAAEIVRINDEDKMPGECEFYVEGMSAMDSNYFRQAYSSKVDGIGMVTECHGTCSCGEELVFELPFNSEFFRPTYDF